MEELKKLGFEESQNVKSEQKRFLVNKDFSVGILTDDNRIIKNFELATEDYRIPNLEYTDEQKITLSSKLLKEVLKLIAKNTDKVTIYAKKDYPVTFELMDTNTVGTKIMNEFNCMHVLRRRNHCNKQTLLRM